MTKDELIKTKTSYEKEVETLNERIKDLQKITQETVKNIRRIEGDIYDLDGLLENESLLTILGIE